MKRSRKVSRRRKSRKVSVSVRPIFYRVSPELFKDISVFILDSRGYSTLVDRANALTNRLNLEVSLG